MKHARKGHRLHLMGLCSDGGVHSQLKHLYALLKMAKQQGVEQVFVHCFMDGRDTPPQSGIGYIREMQKEMREIGVGQDRVGRRPLLRDGSRQALGAHREGVQRHGAGRWRKSTPIRWR